jgi:hypothetical protein
MAGFYQKTRFWNSLLVESSPTDELSAKQLDALTEYTRVTQKIFPDAQRVKVPAWNAKYDELDFRRVILRESIPIESEPSIQLRIYPDLSDLEDPNTQQLRKGADVAHQAMLRFLRTK